MRIAKPVVCTLNVLERKQRGDRWRRVLRRVATDREALPDGVAIRVTCDAATLQTLRELMALEAKCCRWMMLDLREDALGTTLTIRADSAEGVATIRELFG